MAIAKIHNNLDTDYSRAYVRANRTNYSTLDWGIPGIPNPSPSGINAVLDKVYEPFALGSGIYITTGGKYIMPPTFGPVSQFLLINAGTETIFAGINVAISGTWSISKAVAIGSGQSYEFGEPGTQIIRNVWGMSSTSDQLVQGYATNQLSPI